MGPRWTGCRSGYVPGDGGDAPAGLLVPADGALAFSDTAQLDRFPLPAVKAKDSVRLLDGKPTLQIVQGAPGLEAGLPMGPVEGAARAAACSVESSPAGAAGVVARTSGRWGLVVGWSAAGVEGVLVSGRCGSCRTVGCCPGLMEAVRSCPVGGGDRAGHGLVRCVWRNRAQQ
jgi:hypothetical protein